MPSELFRDTLRRGDTTSVLLTITGLNLTGAKLWLTMKDSYDDADQAAALQLTSDDPAEIDIIDAAQGQARIFFEPGDTEILEIRDYYFDIQVKHGTLGIKTVLAGILEVEWDATISRT